MEGDSRNLLQHPRRNLGNRYRSQARKFTKLATTDDTRFADNISWAEQSARQAILYDFTEEENWRCLAEIKVILGDAEGLSSVLEDVFSILGRDPEPRQCRLPALCKQLLHVPRQFASKWF